MLDNIEIGIMQGRLVPPCDGRIQAFPRDGWRAEFPAAQAAGLALIEWIYDAYGADVNPLASDSGLAEIRALSERHGVLLKSVCADYFMDRPLLRCSDVERAKRLDHLEWLLGRCAQAGIGYVILPFVDASRFETDAEIGEFVGMARERILPAAGRAGIEIHLECALPPDRVRELLDRIPESHFRMNYDSGNSSSLGYPPDDEFAAYGGRIGSMHIKDRVLGGSTVSLGTGSADFDSLFRNIEASGYRGTYILQVARGEPGGEIEWARANRLWLERALAGAS